MAAAPESLVVLLADDDEHDVFILQRALRGFEKPNKLFVVSDGVEAIAYLSGEDKYSDRQSWPLPHVLLLDCWMPRVDGVELLAWLRTNPSPLASLPVVLLSGGLAPAQQRTAEAMGAIFCPKALETDALCNAVRKALARALEQSNNSARGAYHSNTSPGIAARGSKKI